MANACTVEGCRDGYVFVSRPIKGGTRYKQERCACNPAPEVQRSSRQSPRFNVRDFDRHTGYQPHLAEFPGDPAAFTDGPWSKDKLIAQRRREGWVPSGASGSGPRPAPATAGTPLSQRVVNEVMERRQRGELLEPGQSAPGTELTDAEVAANEAGDADE